MKKYLHIVVLLLTAACTPHIQPPQPAFSQVDSVYTEADIRTYGDYYNSGHQVYVVDLLSNGLDYDSAGYIIGSGCNLYLSDIFVRKDDSICLPVGTYHMDSTAQNMTFLRGMYFEDNITGTYLLEIKENQIQRITLFYGGKMTIDYEDGDTIFDFHLYTKDSVLYHATYHGYASQ